MAAPAPAAAAAAEDVKIDESLYSRQLYVFGHEAQKKMGQSNVLIVGLKGLGVEIAKNVILAGVKSVGLLDNDPTELRDLSSQFYLTEADIGKPRAKVSFPQLTSLNQYVRTHVVEQPLSEDLLNSGKYQLLVLTGASVTDQVKWNTACRKAGMKFIAADVLGLMASCFVDVGPNHEVSDPDGEQPHRGIVVEVTKENPGIVTVHEDKRHGLSTGDWVTFEEIEGMTQLNDSPARQVKVIDPFSFSIEDTTGYSAYTGNGYFQQVKPPKTLTHKPLDQVLANIGESLIWDIYGHALPLHCIRQGLSKFQDKHGRLPNPTSKEEADEVVQASKEFSGSLGDLKTDVDEKLAFNLARCSSAIISPMAAFLGGVTGQEVLKACSGKFTPISQMYYFDTVEALPENTELKEFAPLNTRYDDQIAVFGKSLHDKITQLKLFLVGAGAIGCEMLKNWALMGIATAAPGQVHVTDMDRIEKSNLNRQFLFRPADVEKLKSQAAAEAVKRMNPDIKIASQAVRVGPDSEELYNTQFWENLDACVTALDNVDARLYVDGRCVFFQKPMIDSGTLGTKGNTQVVVPHKTEAYGSSRDPPEQGIPVCTLKTFPFQIEHTIQWARDTFEGHFTKEVQDVVSYLTDADFLKELAKSPNTQLQTLETVHRLLVTDRPHNFNDCVAWARLQFETEFNHKIKQLRHNFPEDAKTESGTKFWTGNKRFPHPIDFNADDELHMAFILSGANLRAFNFGLPGTRDVNAVKAALAHVVVPEFKVSDVKIAADEKEAKKLEEEMKKKAASGDHDSQVKQITAQLPSPSSLSGASIHPADFEKDDDTNFHMDFITACSNLRARNYRIKESNKHQTKFIAGKIIPAIATTTALVTGLVCLELVKCIQKKPVESYRNTYVNLAIPLFALSEPMPCPTQKCALKENKEWAWSLWDRLEVKCGNVTMQELIDHMQEEFGFEVVQLSKGPNTMYSDMAKKAAAKRLSMPIAQAVEDVTKVPTKAGEKYLELVALVLNEDGDDVEIPPLRIHL